MPRRVTSACLKCFDCMKPTIYWIDNSGPGRLAILARPQGDNALESEIQGWREAGIDVVVSMLTETDNSYLGLSAEAELCARNGLKFISFPIEDCGVPDSLDATLRLVTDLNDLLTSDKSIGFHCQGCVGRSPLIASCVLISSGMSAESAFGLVREARGCPILEGRQAEWGRNFARQLSTSAPP